ncbi:hypothetical protein SEA_DIABLA_69 [Gordonia phage Diabla]|nr:hypothetical protein SEA_DIABLA_69 [Gordonia phage Diabla]
MVKRGDGYRHPARHRWYWRLSDPRGNGLAECAGSYGTAEEAVKSLIDVFTGSNEMFQWLIGETPRDKALAFTATVGMAPLVYQEVHKK